MFYENVLLKRFGSRLCFPFAHLNKTRDSADDEKQRLLACFIAFLWGLYKVGRNRTDVTLNVNKDKIKVLLQLSSYWTPSESVEVVVVTNCCFCCFVVKFVAVVASSIDDYNLSRFILHRIISWFHIYQRRVHTLLWDKTPQLNTLNIWLNTARLLDSIESQGHLVTFFRLANHVKYCTNMSSLLSKVVSCSNFPLSSCSVLDCR